MIFWKRLLHSYIWVWLIGLGSDLLSLEHSHDFTKVSSYAAEPCRCSCSLMEGAGEKVSVFFSPRNRRNRLSAKCYLPPNWIHCFTSLLAVFAECAIAGLHSFLKTAQSKQSRVSYEASNSKSIENYQTSSNFIKNHQTSICSTS